MGNSHPSTIDIIGREVDIKFLTGHIMTRQRTTNASDLILTIKLVVGEVLFLKVSSVFTTGVSNLQLPSTFSSGSELCREIDQVFWEETFG